MTVSTIQSLSAGITRALGTQHPKLASSLKSLLSVGVPVTPEAAHLSVATSLQAQVASLRVASQNLTQAHSLIDVAEGGAGQINAVLGRLQDLAIRAGAVDLSAHERAELDVQFQSLRSQINRIASTTTFNGAPLLDGTASLGAGEEGGQTFAGLTDRDLFGGANLNLADAQSAKDAAAAIAKAQQYVAAQRATLDNLQSGLEVASSTVQAALQNQDAVRSILSDDDFTEQLFGGSTEALSGENALLAQTVKLPSSLIQLLNE